MKMVNFEETANVTTPFTEVVKLTILQRRNDCIEAIEHHRKKKLAGYDMDDHVVRARLYSLWLEVASGYKDMNKDENLGNIIEETKDFSELISIYEKIDLYLYRIRLTKIASFRSYDTTNTEEENEANEG